MPPPAPPSRSLRVLALAMLAVAALAGLTGGWWLFYRAAVEVVVPAAAAPPAPPPVSGPSPAALAALEAALAQARQANGDLVSRVAALEQRLQDDVCPKPPPPPPPPPPPQPKADLPKDRWDRGDVSLLEGCWTLGKETTIKWNTARGPETCAVRAGRICFDAAGSGRRTNSIQCPVAGPFQCEAPVAATFPGDGSMRTTQPEVRCAGGGSWYGEPNWLTCRRVTDAVAQCVDARGHAYEFRR